MKILAIDGNSILNRAFYGVKPLSTKDGRFTNGIVGFLNIFLNALNTVEPDAVAVAFDVRQPTFRHEMYTEYKAGRKAMPPELAEQFPTLKEILSALGYSIVECPGFEADDILGTLSAACREGDFCYISTGDRDSFQLINEKTHVLYASTKATVEYDVQKVLEEYLVLPPQLIDVKALMGDSSDNIPGVAGIGQKTASALISKYENIDKIYEDIDALEASAGVKEKLKKGREAAFLSRELGRINCDAPIERDIEAYQRKNPDIQRTRELLTGLEMYKMLEKLNLKADENANGEGDFDTSKDEKNEAVQFELVSDYDTLFDALKADKKVYFSVSEYAGELDGICIFTGGQAVYAAADTMMFGAFFEKLLTDKDISIYTDNSKSVFFYAARYGVNVKNILMDTSLAGYLLNPNSSDYSISAQALSYQIREPQINISQIFGMGEADVERYKKLALAAAQMPSLCIKLDAGLSANNQSHLLSDIEIPLAKVLASMEFYGFNVDAEGISEFGKSLDSRINDLTASIHLRAGEEFNINSPKQLGEVLFAKMGLPKGKKTKTGYSTNAEVLEALADENPIVGEILEYRTLAKLKSTYCDGLLKVVGKDGRIHSTFNQTETRTGRISSLEPNLQNIPVRQELGRELRRFFVAKEGYLLVDADYSQIELRVLAHIADDKSMIEAFNNNEDIHAITASQVFDMPLEMVTPLMRSRAKAVNFGIVYGIGAFSLAKDIGVARYEADRYIKEYLRHYSGVDNYMNSIIEKAKTDGYVETLYNRRRYLPELRASNAMQRAFGERVARNMPIQGTAADIIKIAMVNVHERLLKEKMDARLILQVHDELIIEAKESDAASCAEILREEMENAASMKVKLAVDVNIGRTWYDAKG